MPPNLVYLYANEFNFPLQLLPLRARMTDLVGLLEAAVVIYLDFRLSIFSPQ